MSDFPKVRLSHEVAEALDSGSAVVALESTLITHGLPWPVNLETACGSETAVREAGAVPATIAVIGGEPRVGLSERELEALARSVKPGSGASEPGYLKAGRRELSRILALKGNAATTVSATLFLARKAGIRVMATGGLGGVHREASRTFDISNDLDELARAGGTLVVCSGVKSILDIAATLERLETLGVAVIGFQTSEFPAFTTRSSGLAIDARVESPEEAAMVLKDHVALHLPGAIVLAQPVAEEFALDGALMEGQIQAAIKEAQRLGISGKQVTPFLLDRIRIAGGGESLKPNQALIIANAGLAARVAKAFESLARRSP